MKNILITGCNGQLGTELQNILNTCSDLNIIATDVEDLDITNDEAVARFFAEKHLDFVVNCAAYTAVDRAENDAALCDRINNVAVAILGKYAAKYNVKIVHISTDYVFDGTNHKPYTEDEPKCPKSVYGRTKADGEDALRAACPEAIIIRTGWLYSPYGNNFVKTMLRLGATKQSLNVVSDQVGTPTYAHDLAQAIAHIINGDNWVPGVYHYSNEGVTSWYDFTKAIHAIAGIITCNVMPCYTNEYPTAAQRPHYSVLDKTKIKTTFGCAVPYWRDSLVKCIDILKQQ